LLRSLNLIRGARLAAQDGDAGAIQDFLFSDVDWVVRYLVAALPGPLGRRILVSPIALEEITAEPGEFRARLPLEQLEQTPDVDADEPITRAWESTYFRFYAWPVYWGGGGATGFWGGSQFPGVLMGAPVPVEPTPAPPEAEAEQESRLHRTADLRGYAVLAADGEELGQVDDFVMDGATWRLAFVCVFSGGRRVLVPVECFDRGAWADGRMNTHLTRQAVETAPDWEPLETIPPEYEHRVRVHFGAEMESAARAAA
jgi:hypothetical protein